MTPIRMATLFVLAATILLSSQPARSNTFVDPDYAFTISSDGGRGTQRAWLVRDAGATLVFKTTIGRTVTIPTTDLSSADRAHLDFLRLPKAKRDQITEQAKREKEEQAALLAEEQRRRDAARAAELARQREAAEKAEATRVAREAAARAAALKVDLDAAISNTGTQLVIANKNTYSWHDVTFSINAGLFDKGYFINAGRIDAGGIYTVGLMTFANKRGERFNPFQMKARDIQITAKKPDGTFDVQSFSWRD